VLSVFFDGVPDSASLSAEAMKDSILVTDSAGRTSVIAKAPEQEYVYHTPYFKQECSTCHENGMRSTKVQVAPSLCIKCHSDLKDKYAFSHGPFAGGYCTECHHPHMSILPKLLKFNDKEMCLLCHEDALLVKSKGHTGKDLTNCTSCHDAHGGSDRYFLK
jgi:predicted CXXCH cytochrome family protein